MTPEPIERLRLDVGRTMRRIGDLLGDFDRLQDDLGRALPSLGELSHAERVEAVSALLGFDATLQQRLREASRELATLLEKLNEGDSQLSAEQWLRNRLDELK